MSWLDEFDLNRRWGGRAQHWLIAVAVALAMTAIGFGPRLLIEPIWPGVVPFALIYPAVLFATLLAGMRAGLLTVLLSQTLVWCLLLSPMPRVDDAISLVLTTLAQLFIVLVISAARRAARRAAALEVERSETLSLALRELDHRTRNNFMLAAALLRIQASRSENAAVKQALEDASNRLMAVEAVQSNIAVSSADISNVSLKAYLEDLCGRLREGLFGDRVHLDCEADDVPLPRDVAMPIGLIVNELITNSLKHAFDEHGGRVAVHAHVRGERLILDVADDGRGRQPGNSAGGVGTRLVKMLTMRLNATLETLPGPGTRYRIDLPLQAAASSLSGVPASASAAGAMPAPAATSARP